MVYYIYAHTYVLDHRDRTFLVWWLVHHIGLPVLMKAHEAVQAAEPGNDGPAQLVIDGAVAPEDRQLDGPVSANKTASEAELIREAAKSRAMSELEFLEMEAQYPRPLPMDMRKVWMLPPGPCPPSL